MAEIPAGAGSNTNELEQLQKAEAEEAAKKSAQEAKKSAPVPAETKKK
jgi:hypothetical protein